MIKNKIKRLYKNKIINEGFIICNCFSCNKFLLPFLLCNNFYELSNEE